VSAEVTRMEAAAATARRGLPAIIIGDEGGLRRLAELLAPYMPAPTSPESDGWMSTREAAEYAGTSTHALHKAMAAREIEFEQEVRGGRAWFRREYIDAWRRGERPGRRAA
jgi:hypothetical protein